MDNASSNTIKGDVVRTLRTYDELYCLTGTYLHFAQKEEKFPLYNCMIVMVFCAFALEAYINHLGEKYVHDWCDYERKMPKEKLKHLLKISNHVIDLESRPYSYMNEIFDYRKLIVHGKTEKIINQQILVLGEIPKLPKTEWEKHTNITQAIKFRKRVKEIITKLSLDVDNEEFPLGSPSDAFWQG